MRRARWITALCVAIIIGTGLTAWVIACGPGAWTLNTRQSSVPAYPEAYSRGQLGLVRPSFQTRYLVEAFRVVNGLPANAGGPTAPSLMPATAPIREWSDLQAQILGGLSSAVPAPPLLDPNRRTKDYASFLNCLDDAFTAATRTLRSRVARYGATSREVADWLAGQAAVFQNCSAPDLVLPAAAPPWADRDLVADREYQTAVAYFYATQYDEAARRFRAIAENPESPWRSVGRYLAARAMIRAATVPDEPADRPSTSRDRLEAAQNDLKLVLQEPAASALHPSARGLLDFVAGKLRPVERLHEVSRRLATATVPTEQDFVDFTWLMRRTKADTEGDELSDWITGMEGNGDRAITRWRETRSAPWLVAALWRVSPQHEQVPSILSAAADVPRTSPVFGTVAFLRVRLLMRRGDPAQARSLLATLPVKTDANVDAEVLNLIRAERFALAESPSELLDNAPRAVVSRSNDISDDLAADPARDVGPVFDDDAGAVFSLRLPLERLVEVSESSRLPARLRRRVAEAAFARAVVLRRPQAGLRLARVLRPLAPVLRADLDRYQEAANDEARHRAGILLILRTPGIHASVEGIEGEPMMNPNLSPRRFDHVYKDNWWCGIPGQSATIPELYETQPIPAPSFLTMAERGAAEQELSELRVAGQARAYLATQAIAWAQAAPTDLDAAEALAQSVEGWRWSYCYEDGGAKPSDLPRRAFQTLHRLFPKSQWASRTKYWYQ